jgi:hypothetical protein
MHGRKNIKIQKVINKNADWLLDLHFTFIPLSVEWEDILYCRSGKCNMMSNVGETPARRELIHHKVSIVPQFHWRVLLPPKPLARTRSMKKHQ